MGPRASERYGEETVLTLVGSGTSDRPASSLVTFVDYAGRAAAFSFRCVPIMKASRMCTSFPHGDLLMEIVLRSPSRRRVADTISFHLTTLVPWSSGVADTDGEPTC